jgi:4-amino-4-deoxy-L-arabinose transferase-like glycosyltransferase
MLPTSSAEHGNTYGIPTAPASARRRGWIILTVSLLVLVALLLRLHVAWQRNHESPDALALRLTGDETNYDSLASALLQGAFFQWPGRPPVYPLFIAATYYALGERSLAKLLYVQAFVGALAVPLTYLLARRLTGVIPAMVAAGIVGLDEALIFHTRQIYTEVLYTPLLLMALLVLLWALHAARLGRFAWAGAGMAVVTLCRPTTMLLPLLLPLLPSGWSLKRRAAAFLVFSLAMAAVIVPWTYHNWREYHRFLPVSVSVGALWQGSPEFYHLTQRGRNHLDIWANELNPVRNGGHDPFSIDGDQYFSRRAVQSIRAEPGVYVIYSLKKAAYFWFGNPAAEWANVGFHDWQVLRQWYPYSWLRLLNMVATRQLPLVALVALVFLAVRGRLRPLVPFLLIFAYFLLMHMITWSELRYSQPLHPLLAIIVVMAGMEGLAALSSPVQGVCGAQPPYT